MADDDIPALFDDPKADNAELGLSTQPKLAPPRRGFGPPAAALAGLILAAISLLGAQAIDDLVNSLTLSHTNNVDQLKFVAVFELALAVAGGLLGAAARRPDENARRPDENARRPGGSQTWPRSVGGAAVIVAIVGALVAIGTFAAAMIHGS